MCPRTHALPVPAAMRHRDAIDFALDRLEPFEVCMFLEDLRDGNLTPWPEFLEFLAGRDAEGSS